MCMRPRLYEVSEEDAGEGTVVEDVPNPAGSRGAGADVSRTSDRPP